MIAHEAEGRLAIVCHQLTAGKAGNCGDVVAHEFLNLGLQRAILRVRSSEAIDVDAVAEAAIIELRIGL
jgi:hypothetical protein